MKKRILSLVLMISMIASLLVALPITANAEKEGIFTYTIENGEVTITDCDISASGEIIIPDTIEGCPVTAIGEKAFGSCDGLNKIIIPDGVTSIGEYAFIYCDNLTNIVIPDSVTSVGFDAFAYSGLTEITIPDSVISIGSGALFACNSLTSINVEEENPNYSSVDGTLFTKDKTTLIKYPVGKSDESYNIPDSVTTIDGFAFSGGNSLTKISVPVGVLRIDTGAFRDCINLKDITVDENNLNYSSDNGNLFNKDKTILMQYAIGKSDNIYNIPDSVTRVDAGAFSSCSNLKQIIIPETVTNIDVRAFFDCDSLTNITIPNSVKSIGWLAFCDCDNLTTITIPISITSIDESAFKHCDNITDVYYGGTEEKWNTIAIGKYNENLTNAIIHFVYTLGDSDGDGEIGVKDVIALRRFITGGYVATLVKEVADVKKDGVIDAKDVIIIRRFITGGYGVEL